MNAGTNGTKPSNGSQGTPASGANTGVFSGITSFLGLSGGRRRTSRKGRRVSKKTRRGSKRTAASRRNRRNRRNTNSK